MQIQIVTPEKNLLTEEVEEVYAYGPKGEFGVLPGHAHYVTPLATGRLYFTQGDQRRVFVVRGGYMEVQGEKVLVAVDQVETVAELDRQASEENLAALEEKLGSESLEPEEFNRLTAERQHEQARLQVLSQ